MSYKSFTVNLHSTICMNVKELLARSRCHIWTLSDSNEIWTHNHLVPKRTLNHLANLTKLTSLAKWLSVGLWTKWLWVRIPLLSLVIVSRNNLTGRRLTLSWRRPLSYRNQSINLRSKSMNWFLYDNGLRHERVNSVLLLSFTNIKAQRPLDGRAKIKHWMQ